MDYTYPNAVVILYAEYYCRQGKSYNSRQEYISKKDNLSFIGERNEALEFFRNIYPSKSIIFRSTDKNIF